MSKTTIKKEIEIHCPTCNNTHVIENLTTFLDKNKLRINPQFFCLPEVYCIFCFEKCVVEIYSKETTTIKMETKKDLLKYKNFEMISYK